MAGVTGTKNVNPNTIAPYVQLIKKHSKLPVAVGFGIKTPQHARDVSIYSDAVVIGSVLVEKIENYVKTYSSKSAPEKLVEEISEFVASVKNVL
jgi:tryptophan synthase alpha chain